MKDLEQFSVERLEQLASGDFIPWSSRMTTEERTDLSRIALAAKQKTMEVTIRIDDEELKERIRKFSEIRNINEPMGFIVPEADYPAIQDGWALVPIEPTEGMVIGGFESEPDESFSEDAVWEEYDAMTGCQQAAHRAKLCWAAMLAAAPKPEAQ